MDKFDIEAYLDGRLAEEERVAFEQEMNQNPALLQQVEAQREATELLKRYLLREKINTILVDKPAIEKPYRWAWAVLIALLILLVSYFMFWRKQYRATPNNPPTSKWKPDSLQIAPHAPMQQLLPDSLDAKVEKAQKPPLIAENKASELPLPAYPSPNIRGYGGDNAAWKALLDKVWYTQLPPKSTSFKAPFTAAAALLSNRDFENAFLELETLEAASPQNDTLLLLKGYCLLEMGEGADALRYFQQLDESHPNWKAWLEWHRALAKLISGGKDKASPEFKKIAKQSNHSFQRQAQKTLDLLE